MSAVAASAVGLTVQGRSDRTGRAARPDRSRGDRPVRSARPRPGGDGRPRLLLLPPVDPQPGRLVEAPLHEPPTRTSVRSPLTEAVWAARPVPEPEPVDLPDPAEVARAIVVATVEALAGARPLSQLVRWVTPELHEHLVDARGVAGPLTGTALRASARGATVCRLGPDVAEATVVVHDGRKVRAAAVRLEVHRRRWRATVLEIY
nr:Rv3235 family protein [uncultured Actinotalea sp.]